jgi:putative FmdB family regulatory protein
MPIFEYRCAECGHVQDHFHRSRNETAPLCKHCRADALERLVSLTSFQLKGKGWYVSDYKPSGNGPAKAAPATDGVSKDVASKDAPAKDAPAKDAASDASGGSDLAARAGSEPSSSLPSSSSDAHAKSGQHAA